MFLLDWFYGVLASLGLWQKEANIKEANILFLSFDHARRTTLLSMLKDERLVQDQPTQYLLIAEEFRIGKIKFKAFDWGGTRTSRRVWQDYHVKVDRLDGARDNSYGLLHGFLDYILHVENNVRSRTRAVKDFKCNIDRRMGYQDGFEWLSLQL